MRHRPFDVRRLVAAVVTAVLLVAVVWGALYAAREDREPPRVIGRVRHRAPSVPELEPVTVQTDPVTGQVVVIAKDRRGRLSRISLPAPHSQGLGQPVGGLPTASPALPAPPPGARQDLASPLSSSGP